MNMDESKPAPPDRYSLRLSGWYRLFRSIVRPVFWLVCRFEVRGLEHISPTGPYLLVINHLHWLDPPALMAAFPHRAHIFSAEKWEHHWLLGPLMRSMDAIFVQRGEVDRKALRRALAVLEGGGVLGLAPEGTRSKTGGLQRGRSGAAFMALRTGCRVQPVVCTGQERVFPSLKRLRRARLLTVFGPPFQPSPAAAPSRPTSAEVHALTEEIMVRLASLLPAEYRGIYADVEEKRPDLMPPSGANRQ